MNETLNYDKNGNITDLVRLGHIVGGTTVPNIANSQHFGTMDNLSYTYAANSNNLLKVADSANKTYGFRDGTNTGDDYAYDANGNMTRDLNKDIGTSAVNGIVYNFLNLPTEVKFNNSNTKKINYIYDATGNKLEKKVTEGSSTIRTYYAGSYVYEYVSGHVEELKFFSHPEGYAEVRNRGADPGGDPWNPPVPDFDYVFQYKDHLGNVRLSYKKNSNGINGIGSTSEVFFEDFESASGWDSEGAKYGTSLVYNGEHTRSGDYAGVLSRTNDADIYSHSNTWIDIDNSVPTRYDFSGWVYAEDVSGNTSRCKIMLFMNEEGETEYYTLIAESTSTYLVGQWVYLKGSYIVPPNIKKINLRVDMHSGGGAGTAWFDDLSIHRVNAAEIVAENHYYPFGLEHKGYNNVVNGTEHKYKYNGKEYQDELNLNVYDYGARMYMPDIGRWGQIDPLSEFGRRWSPYTYAMDNPVYFIDPDGMWSNPNPLAWLKQQVDSRVNQIKKDIKEGWNSFKEGVSNVFKEGTPERTNKDGGTDFYSKNGGGQGPTTTGKVDERVNGDDIMSAAGFAKSGRDGKKGDGKTNAKLPSTNRRISKNLELFQEGMDTGQSVGNVVNKVGGSSMETQNTPETTTVTVKDSYIGTDTSLDGTQFYRTRTNDLKVQVPNNKNSVDSVRNVYENKSSRISQEVNNKNNELWNLD